MNTKTETDFWDDLGEEINDQRETELLAKHWGFDIDQPRVVPVRSAKPKNWNKGD